MVYCPWCFEEMEALDEICAKCGRVRAEFQERKHIPVSRMEPERKAVSAASTFSPPVDIAAGIFDVFDLNMTRMITPGIVRAFYSLCVTTFVLMYLGNLVIAGYFAFQLKDSTYGMYAIIAAIGTFTTETLFLFVGLIIVRIFCERALVSFDMREALRQIAGIK